MLPDARSFLLLTVFALLVLAAPAHADDSVPRGEGIQIDGRLDDAVWKAARVLPVAALQTPALPPADGDVPLDIALRVIEVGGRLCFGLEVAEDPSAWMGLLLKIAPAGTSSAADAVEVAFRPQSLRALAFTVRGPGGADRQAYWVEGAADWSARGRWSLELAVDLAPFRDAEDPALRVGAAVLTRTPNLIASSPSGAVFRGPDDWHRFAPTGGAWFVGEAPDLEAMESFDARDRKRLIAWNHFLGGVQEIELDPVRGGTRPFVRAQIDERLLRPLSAVLEHRPDLVPGIETLRGDILRQLGLRDEALAAFARALADAPGWREARFTRAFTVEFEQLIERPADQPGDYAAAYARLEAIDTGDDPWRADAVEAARGALLYREGRFTDALNVLDPLAQRYPSVRLLGVTRDHARKYRERLISERMERKRDRKRNLPRVRVVTTGGAFEAELLQHAAPNTVNNFIWLSREGFYDGVAFHRNLPFFLLQSGDPFSRPVDAGGKPGHVGLGGPGYDILAETSERAPYRGALAMVRTGSGTIGSQFVVITGTAAHLQDDVVVFGRVVDGQDVIDALVEGDRIERIEVLKAREGWTYHPTDISGGLPAKPEATASPAPGR